ncbi:MAG TPA: glycosyltransferase family 2 protein [Candidatus Andersenbacteria bacterium]|nr:glycosyltransferase family 2 protein [Candidatus Andersenbacteria bacterium]
MAPKLTIQLLGWNGAIHLQETAPALQEVPRDQAIVRYIDNGSEDASLEIVQDLLPHADILRLETNKGFAGAHNAGFAVCTTPYVLTLDQDIAVNWEGLEKLIHELDKNPKLGAVQGKLYRKEGKKILDSAGIVATLALNGKERGSNEPDTGQYEIKTDLFAVTGGCGMYRMEALRSVSHTHTVMPAPEPASTRGSRVTARDDAEVFDSDFFAYKEDVDLGWRLNKAGWAVQYIPVLVGYHARTMGRRGLFNWGIGPKNISERITNNRTRLSLRNYIWMLAKNMTFADELKYSVFIAIRLSIFFILSLFSWNLFSVWKEAFAGIEKMHGKRSK